MDRHCCEDMRREAERACDEHPDRHECPDCLIHYSSPAGAYGLIVHDGGHSVVRIHYCPWCGSRWHLEQASCAIFGRSTARLTTTGRCCLASLARTSSGTRDARVLSLG